jgi:hypothetical protein
MKNEQKPIEQMSKTREMSQMSKNYHKRDQKNK